MGFCLCLGKLTDVVVDGFEHRVEMGLNLLIVHFNILRLGICPELVNDRYSDSTSQIS